MENKENLYNQMKELEQGELIASINKEVIDALQWISLKENNLNLTVQALQENRYGFYDKDLILKAYSDLEDLRLERLMIISSVGEALLGESWREILNETGCEFRIDNVFPVVIIFKP